MHDEIDKYERFATSASVWMFACLFVVVVVVVLVMFCFAGSWF